MTAYVINDMEITDPALFEQYKKLSPATVAQYGGRFLARGGAIDTIEGDWSPKRIVILEFPTAAQARAWAASVEYAPAKALRQRSARSRLIVVDGAPPTGRLDPQAVDPSALKAHVEAAGNK